MYQSNLRLKKEFKAKDLAQKELHRVNRALYTLSACNKSLVKIHDEPTLIQTICDLLVSKGGYALAWVGYFENNNGFGISIQYQAGVIKPFPAKNENSKSETKNPLLVIKKTGSPIVIHYEAGNTSDVWCQYAVEHQLMSSFFLPLVEHETIIGVLALYSADHLLNDEKENDLIFEMAGDLAFGISTIRMKATHEEVVQTLKESEQKYGTVTENLNVGIFRCSPNSGGCFLEANPALIQIFGYPDKESFLQIKMCDLFQFQTDVRNFHRRMNENGCVLNEETLMRCRDGEPIWCSINANAVYDSAGQIQYYDGVVENINNRKKLEKEKKEMQLHLFQAQKMEEVGVLAGGVAHDFNNILTAMLSISELANRGAGITRQLLIFSRKQHVNFAVIDVNEIIENLRKMLDRLLGENILIETNLDTKICQCCGDKGTLNK